MHIKHRTSILFLSLALYHFFACSSGEQLEPSASALSKFGIGGPEDEKGIDMLETSNGNLLILGTKSVNNSDGYDAWLVKTNDKEKVVWERTYGGSLRNDKFETFIQTSDGGIALIGFHTNDLNNSSLWLMKTDGNGNVLWEHTYEEEVDANGIDLIEIPDGGFALFGKKDVNRSNGEWSDLWLVRTDALGTKLWERTYGDQYSNWPYDFSYTVDEGFILLGSRYMNGFSSNREY